MNIEETISILKTSLITIANAKAQAREIGDLAHLVKLDQKELETQETILKLGGSLET